MQFVTKARVWQFQPILRLGQRQKYFFRECRLLCRKTQLPRQKAAYAIHQFYDVRLLETPTPDLEKPPNHMQGREWLELKASYGIHPVFYQAF